ncbi:hypothetical protein Cpir12675_002183, partial [Ceratocystis pirilliformis]
MAPLYRKLPNLLGYADDGAMIIDGPTFEDNCLNIETFMKIVIDWTTQNGLELDQEKTGLLHIKGRKRTKGNPPVTIE